MTVTAQLSYNMEQHSFKISRDIRQGCPISPFLFLLVTQTMAIDIKIVLDCGIRILERVEMFSTSRRHSHLKKINK